MTRRVITIDIETLPAPGPAEVGDKRTSTDGGERDARTALNGDFGRILCIGYYDEKHDGAFTKGVIGWDETLQGFACDERALLVKFWEMMRGFSPNSDRIVGHNIFDFDLKFIYKRSVVHGIRPAVELSFARYRSRPIFDTMHEWERWSFGSRIKLDRLATVLSLQSSKADGVDGSHVCELFEKGEHRAIRDYCLRDVELTRAIYRRMVFADSVPSTFLNASPSMMNSSLCAAL